VDPITRGGGGLEPCGPQPAANIEPSLSRRGLIAEANLFTADHAAPTISHEGLKPNKNRVSDLGERPNLFWGDYLIGTEHGGARVDDPTT
jgi:hypothetical protein